MRREESEDGRPEYEKGKQVREEDGEGRQDGEPGAGGGVPVVLRATLTISLAQKLRLAEIR